MERALGRAGEVGRLFRRKTFVAHSRYRARAERTRAHGLACAIPQLLLDTRYKTLTVKKTKTLSAIVFIKKIYKSVGRQFELEVTIGKFSELFEVRTWAVWCKMTLDRVDSFVGKIQPAASVSCLSQCQNIFGKRLKRWGSTGSWVSNCFVCLRYPFLKDF